MSDIAYVEGGSSIKAFDSEGYATRDTILIGEGQLQSLLHNSHTASFFGIENTANGSRSAKGGLGVAGRHTVIAAGTSSHAEATAGEYLELVELQGVHSGQMRSAVTSHLVPVVSFVVMVNAYKQYVVLRWPVTSIK
ncbi:TldE protein [Photobacterium aphoticum]|uniref:TldE protein n=1 Tax=Photobacterium aphoticum TaxID=754436 RepID=A0A090QMA3_9GAMM|nr:TldE protein [Photobacterium aphoticum]